MGITVDVSKVSDFDKEAFSKAQETWGALSQKGESVGSYIRKESAKLDPGHKDYLAEVRRLELLGAYDAAVDVHGETTTRKDSYGAKRKSVGVMNLEKALAGSSPTGNPLPSQHIAADRGLHEVMNDKMKGRFFSEHEGNIISKMQKMEMLGHYAKKATGTYGKVAMGAAALISGAAQAAENDPNASAGTIAMAGLRAAADQSLNGLGDLLDGKGCEGGTKLAGTAIGGVVGLIPWVGGLAGGYIEDKANELTEEMCAKPATTLKTSAMRNGMRS